MVRVLKSVLFSLALIGVAACGAAERGDSASPTAPVSATPSPTRTHTPTSTLTPTPTPTAPPVVVSGDLRSLSLSEPVRQSGAPCGFVDTLDFPLDPPDGEAASDGMRKAWEVSGPHFGGMEIYHLKGSPVDPNRIYASQAAEWFGQVMHRSDDGGETWDTVGSRTFHTTATFLSRR